MEVILVDLPDLKITSENGRIRITLPQDIKKEQPDDTQEKD